MTLSNYQTEIILSGIYDKIKDNHINELITLPAKEEEYSIKRNVFVDNDNKIDAILEFFGYDIETKTSTNITEYEMARIIKSMQTYELLNRTCDFMVDMDSDTIQCISDKNEKGQYIIIHTEEHIGSVNELYEKVLDMHKCYDYEYWYDEITSRFMATPLSAEGYMIGTKISLPKEYIKVWSKVIKDNGWKLIYLGERYNKEKDYIDPYKNYYNFIIIKQGVIKS